jgi:hypothetical protein
VKSVKSVKFHPFLQRLLLRAPAGFAIIPGRETTLCIEILLTSLTKLTT